MSHRWTHETARLASKKGLLARLKVAPERQPEYRKGYQAGWRACDMAYRRMLGFPDRTPKMPARKSSAPMAKAS